MRKALLICAVLIVNTACGTELTTVTFDELPEQPLNGTSVKGVTFEFTGSTPRMEVALFGATRLSFAESKLLNAPWIEAPTVSGLTMRFAQPTPFLSFDLGYAGGAPLTPGYTVNLFSGATQIGSTAVNTAIGGTSPFSFNEGKFTYNDPSRPLTSATLTLAQPPPSDIFVVDNVAFVPEPSITAFIVLGAYAILGSRRRAK
ncbi:MAG TPA: hypothetical protein VM680_08965 [Verrucomicrobiae bacterium]|nr:hypothetical protein [Verrucomicrobiae bacterium]